MVALSRRARRTLESPATPRVSEGSPTSHNAGRRTSGYEQLRDERIKQNLERMQKLGILDLSRQVKSEAQSHKRAYRNQTEKRSPQVSLPAGPARRSFRLQNLTPVSYVEVGLRGRTEEFPEDGKDLLREGQRPEIYAEEHDKLLGTCEATWELFKDGYDSTGRRIYDPVKGKTCHQCRQKTLGHRTHCSKCSIVQGQFCGDCLYMRYGEHVLEAKQNPNWICPVCRGICNCSLCRIKKGWAPTGPLYKKILRLGFKSVAHYLVQTRRSQMTSVEPISAKRSLPFMDTDSMSQLGEFTSEDNDASGCSKPALEEEKDPDTVTRCDGVAQVADLKYDREAQRTETKYDGELHSKVEKYDRGDCTTYEISTGEKQVLNVVQSTPIIIVANEGKGKEEEILSSDEKFDGEVWSSEEKGNEEVHSKEDKNDGADCSSFEEITGDKNGQNVVQDTLISTGQKEDKSKQEIPSSSERSAEEAHCEDVKNDGGNCGLCEKSTGGKEEEKVGQGAPIISAVIPVESEEKSESEAVQSSDEKSDGEVQTIEKKHDGGDCISHEKVQNTGEDTPIIRVEGEKKLRGRKPKGYPVAITDSISTAKKRAADRLLFTTDSIAGRLRKRACRS